jgi:hypothetical protein
LAAKAGFEKSREALERVHTRRSWIQYGLIFAGAALAGIGVVTEGIAKMKDDNPQRRR